MYIKFFLFSFLTLSIAAGDWPRFLGPNSNDQVSPESGFSADFTKWKKAWEINVGVGYSTVSVLGDKAYTMGHDGKETETIYCLDPSTGKEIWKYSYKGMLINKLHLGGPNATAELEGDFLYTLSKDGKAFCLNRTTGKLVWKTSILKEFGMEQPAFGFAGSPVIYKDWVLFTCGKACALNKKTGKVIWISKYTEKEESAYHPGHATPVVFEYNNNAYLLLYVGTGIEVLQLKDGKQVGRYNVTARFNMTASTPLVYENGSQILVSWSAYSALLGFDGSGLKQIWKQKGMIRSMQNSVRFGDTVFGVSGLHGSKRAEMAAVDIKSGKPHWSQKGINWSQITAVGDTLLCMDIKGELVSVKANKSKFEELSRTKLFKSTCWTKVTYANGNIYARNNKGQVLCLSLK